MARLALLGFVLMIGVWPTAAVAIEAPRPSLIVVLRATTGLCGSSGHRAIDRQMLPDGTLVPFAIPPGAVLVVTGMAWNFLSQPPNSVQGLGFGPQIADQQLTTMFITGALADGVGRSLGSIQTPQIVLRGDTAFPPCVFGPNPENIFIYGFLHRDI
jgi:hypothetical protein